MRQHFLAFDRCMGRFYHAIGNLVGVLIGLFALFIILDLGLRLLDLGNLPGMHELVEYALFAGVFLGAPWALRLGAHIRVDLVANALPLSAARWLERALDGFGALIALTLAWYGAKNLAQAYKFGAMQRKTFDVYEWWLLSVFVVSFVLMAIEFASRILRGDQAFAREERGV